MTAADFAPIVDGERSGAERVRIALALLLSEKGALEASIDAERFNGALSRRLDAVVIAIEALEALSERAEPAA